MIIGKTRLAAILKLTPQRVGQLQGLGVLRAGDKFDLYESIGSYIDFLRRNEPAEAAKNRHLAARIVRAEMLNSREMRRLLTLDEVRELVQIIVDRAVEYAQSASQAYFIELTNISDPMERRRQTDKVFQPLNQTALAWRNGAGQLLDDLEKTYMPEDVRLGERLREILDAANARIDSTPAPSKPSKNTTTTKQEH